ncbi:hypothetical protein OESDEN_14541 [Oesophagostomum dentatum]|uniref:Uncharacterized protein n=1 Tax=Oesophagostomum dentatum TaxID=61180 RepID=A0A0B1SRB3_OESDE|nr:hypothetical protein OESDEN_14541 [Oesophagostomum dentatum]
MKFTESSTQPIRSRYSIGNRSKCVFIFVT